MIEQIKKFPRFGELKPSFNLSTENWIHTQDRDDEVTFTSEVSLFCCIRIGGWDSNIFGSGRVIVGSLEGVSIDDYRAAYDEAVADYDSKQKGVEVSK